MKPRVIACTSSFGTVQAGAGLLLLMAKSRHKKAENVPRYFKPSPEAIAEVTRLLAPGDRHRWKDTAVGAPTCRIDHDSRLTWIGSGYGPTSGSTVDSRHGRSGHSDVHPGGCDA
jgi:hypothetical protein